MQEIANLAKELGQLSQARKLQGTPNAELRPKTLAAVMIEKVPTNQEPLVRQKAKDLNVFRVVRSGKALHVQSRFMGGVHSRLV